MSPLALPGHSSRAWRAIPRLLGAALVLAALFHASAARAADPVVSNVQVEQRRDGSKRVDIRYDVADADTDTLARVWVEVSPDSGRTWQRVERVSGDVGQGVLTGPGRRIVWDAGAEWPGREGTGYLAKVVASVEPEPGTTRSFPLPGGGQMEFVWVPAGTFTMGSPSSEAGRDSDEGPQHQVSITRGFWLGKYEVTQGQWEGVMGTRPWAAQGTVQVNPQNPAVYISWNDVQGLVQRLNQAAGDSVYRLPSEAEWEYACRAGTTTRWSFGEDERDLGGYAWYDDNACRAGACYAHDVGTKLANPWGLFDMHGNVREWVGDWYGSYGSGAQTDPGGPGSGSYRVIRGGSFFEGGQTTRSADRGFRTPDDRIFLIGCRLSRTESSNSPDAGPDSIPGIPANTAPEANAGPDQTAHVGATVTLDGSASRDADGDGLAYHWTAPPGTAVSDLAVPQPTFAATAPGTYQFTLTVNDGPMLGRTRR
ncbi:MAG: SUMF1/EgtB/PvdO family nonheme iron enzyme [Candidatus Latescibacterota bacterium]